MYPKTLNIVVNSQEEEDKVLLASPQSNREEYPKMVYLHPEEKNGDHTFVIVHNEEEKKAALKQGYQLDAHVPQHDGPKPHVVKLKNGILEPHTDKRTEPEPITPETKDEKLKDFDIHEKEKAGKRSK